MNEASEKISKILEDPESIKMIAQIAESLLNTTESTSDDKLMNSEDQSSFETEKNADNNQSSIKMIKELFADSDIDNTIRLITSLRPYLSHRRRGNTDNVLRILNILKMAERINISDLNNLLR